MYPLTEKFPKALLPIGNKPMIAYQIEMLERNGF
jgi:translation initiation factor eIF-2B subunit gamma